HRMSYTAWSRLCPVAGIRDRGRIAGTQHHTDGAEPSKIIARCARRRRHASVARRRGWAATNTASHEDWWQNCAWFYPLFGAAEERIACNAHRCCLHGGARGGDSQFNTPCGHRMQNDVIVYDRRIRCLTYLTRATSMGSRGGVGSSSSVWSVLAWCCSWLEACGSVSCLPAQGTELGSLIRSRTCRV